MRSHLLFDFAKVPGDGGLTGDSGFVSDAFVVEQCMICFLSGNGLFLSPQLECGPSSRPRPHSEASEKQLTHSSEHSAGETQKLVAACITNGRLRSRRLA